MQINYSDEPLKAAFWSASKGKGRTVASWKEAAPSRWTPLDGEIGGGQHFRSSGKDRRPQAHITTFNSYYQKIQNGRRRIAKDLVADTVKAYDDTVDKQTAVMEGVKDGAQGPFERGTKILDPGND